MIALKETAVTRVGETRVGCGNLWEREYALPDGTQVTGLSARISYDDETHFVGVGSEIVIGGGRYRVVGIDKQQGAIGSVRIEAVAG